MEHNRNNNHYSNLDDQLSEIANNLGYKLNIEEQRERNHDKVDEDDEEEIEIVVDDDVDDEDGEFEFAFERGELSSPVSAEEVFRDGKIRPLFPFTMEDAAARVDAASYGPPVRKLFVVEDNDVAVGPYCVWSEDEDKKTAPPEMSKKSNSTGFSKLWRVKDLLVRSNSDGRDAFVFLHKKEAAVKTAPAAEVKKERKVSLRRLRIGGESSTTAGGDGGEKKVKKGKKPVAATTATTAYEALYGGKEKKKVGKSYLPYRQDLVGFFTNSNGMTRNVHPY